MSVFSQTTENIQPKKHFASKYSTHVWFSSLKHLTKKITKNIIFTWCSNYYHIDLFAYSHNRVDERCVSSGDRPA